jgi:hypothetical protein
MLTAIENTEMNTYISNLSKFVSLINKTSEYSLNSGFNYLKELSSLFQIKTENNLLDSFKINSSSGFISYGEILNILSQKKNIDMKLDYSFDFDEIQNKIITGIDSSDENDFNLENKMNSLSTRYYLSMLNKSSLNAADFFNSKLQEAGESSDLIQVEISGYSKSLSCPCSYVADFYYAKSKLKKRKIKIDELGEIEICDSLKDKFTGLLGLESRIIYEIIRNEKELEPRKVKRTVFAPFYNPFYNNLDDSNNLDPHNEELFEFTKSLNDAYIFSIHEDISTKYFSGLYDESSIEKPSVEFDHKYFSLDKKMDKKISSFIPKENIVSLKSKK